MTSGLRTASLHLDTVDDALGPAAGRFFGEGYQRVRYTLSDPAFEIGDDTLTGRAALTLTYPVDWSRKDGQDRAPHLSTIDALVVGARIAEQALAATGVAVSDLPAAFVRSLRIRAGSRPVEQLGRIDVRCARRGAARPVTGTGRAQTARSAFDVVIGAMRIDVEIEHPLPRAAGGVGATVEPPAAGVYVNGFADRRLRIAPVDVDPDTLTAAAGVRLSSVQKPQRAGLEGAYQPAVTVFDAFVTTLQLGQVLLYQHDGVSRDESNNLWMRQTHIEREHPVAATDTPVPAVTRLANVGLLSKGGHDWRTADVVGELAGIAVTCSVTHQLPDRD